MKTGTLDHRRTGAAVAVAFAALAAAITALALFAHPALAATFAVDRTDDSAVASACTAAANDCSLRGAIIAANAAAGADTITVPAENYVLSITSTGEDASANGDLDITGDLTINGAGARTTTIDAKGIDRVFHIPSSVVIVGISGVTITGGEVVGEGGGISTAFSNSDLTLTNVAVTGNTASDSDGGGIYFYDGTLTITKSAISGNTAEGGAGNGSGGRGGGIYVDDGEASITNSTISGNTATDGVPDGGSADGRGGGISNGSGVVELLNATVNANTATRGGNVDNSNSNNFTLKNTIVSNAVTGDNCSDNEGEVSDGNNIADDESCDFDQTSDITNEDPDLGPLANNGGPTNTHALLSGSPAIGEAETGAPATDQRGVSRPQPAGGVSDIGAFELAANGGGGGGNNPKPKPKPKPGNNQSNACTIKGTPGNDILRGTPRRDVICAGPGNDIIKGLGGNDRLLGGPGNDVFRGGSGSDYLDGGSGHDAIHGQRGDDTLLGRAGNDALHGQGGRDRLNGGPGRDTMHQ